MVNFETKLEAAFRAVGREIRELQSAGLFREHASMEAIDAAVDAVSAARRVLDQHTNWLAEVRGRRMEQIAAGTWPAGKE